MLPSEQIESIKQQLISQLEATNLPNKEATKQSIITMNSEQLEQFLIKNNLIKTSDNRKTQKTQQCIFCSIVFGETPSYKIDENKDSIAILELNPVSKGHTLIIPKEHITTGDKIPQTSFTLAKKIAKKIKSKFKPKDVTIASANILGHEIINVFPVYENETIQSQRNQTNPEDLAKLQKTLEVKKRTKTIRKTKISIRKKIPERKLWLPKRIP